MTLESIITEIDKSRSELLDLGLRNPLLNYRLLKSRGVEVVDELPSAVFDILSRKGRSMSFLPRPDDDEDYEMGQPDFDDDPDTPARRHTDNRLQTNEPSDRLQSRLLKTYYAANTVIQEQGVNTLFAALGMVEWYESDASDISRRAPLVLIPVKLDRAGARDRFYVSYTEEELGANLSFIEKARNDFGIEIPGLPEDEDLDVDEYFSKVSRSIEDKKRWTVDRSSIVLGLFSFNKFLMYRDLDPSSDGWPGGYGPRNSPIIRALFGEGFSEPDPRIGESDHLDDHLAPEDVHHVMDADSSQALAILDVNQSRNLVIEGPPGTGKSQTITNVIAEALAEGRKVLFVSEKMAALEVVKRRLDAIGLGAACLEMHSHKTTKRAVLDELRKTWELGEPSTEGMEDDFTRLKDTRSRLNEYAEAVNSPVGGTGTTPYKAYGKLVRIRDLEKGGVQLPRVQIADAASWSAADFASKLQIVSELQTRLERVGVPSEHVFWGSRLRLLLPDEQASLGESIGSAISSLNALDEAARSLSSALGLSPPGDAARTLAVQRVAEHAAKAPSIEGVDLTVFEPRSQRDEMKRLADAGVSWARLRSEYDAILKPDAWGVDVRATRDILASVGRKFWKLARPQFHLASNNPGISQELIDAAIESLNMLTKAVHDLSDAIGLGSPEDMAQTGALMRVAEHAAKAPSIEGVDLTVFEPRSQRDEMKRLADAGVSWARLRSEYDAILKPDAWGVDVRATRDILASVGRKFWKFLSPSYRRAKEHIASLYRAYPPFDIGTQIETAEAVLEEQEHRRTFERLSSAARAALGAKWRGTESDWDALSRIVGWTANLLDDVDSGGIAPNVVRYIRDDIDAAHVRDLFDKAMAASDSHNGRVEELHSALDVDIVGTRLRYAEQGDILAAWSRENNEIRRANAHLSSLCRADLPDSIESQIETAEAILEEQDYRRTFEQLSPAAGAALGAKWQGTESDWDALRRIVEWTANLLGDVANGEIAPDVVRSLRDDIDAAQVDGLLTRARAASDSHAKRAKALQDLLQIDNERILALPFTEQRRTLTTWADREDEAQDLVGFNAAAHNAEKEGLGAMVELAHEWPGAADHLKTVLERARYEGVLSRAMKERPALSSFDREVHEGLIERFRSMDELALDHNRYRVARSHSSQTPPRHGAIGELGVLRREFEKKRRHLPIRRLMAQAGNAIQAIKPVFMMSPLSIASYLSPGSVRFDLVVFDEASQVRPVDAVGALMRADQAVVVGDSRQLPPTSFFDAVTQSDDEEEESMTADVESILGLFRSQGAPDRMLRWHYRSRHESLIAVSNKEFYENRLVVFPSPDPGREELGLRYHHLPDAVYDRAVSRTNRKEAAEVAKAVMRHARETPNLTLGVAAFSSAQREAVQDELERLRRRDTSWEGFFINDHPDEPFFVKNLENVQGDERDVIFISVGYGRDASGQVSMNFGPLNTAGGERRLNVLITRAKMRCHVFTNLRADDIDLNRTGSRGLRAFKAFLAYADTGALEEPAVESGREVDSPFQKAVADRLRSLGHDVREEVASGGKFIDLAVVDPERRGRYILGIECDGASYHSSRSARDRDRLREQHLKDLGWRLHRIWSTDWFKHPDRELKRAAEAIEQAKAAPPAAPVESRAKPEIERVEGDRPSEPAVQPYEVARPSVDIRQFELHEVPWYLLRPSIDEIVRVEGPVHVSEARRRIADAVGVTKIGRRIEENLDHAILYAERQGTVVVKGGFLWSTDVSVPSVRDRTDLPGKNIEMVAPEEVAEAVKMVVERSYGIDRADAATQTGRLLGFKRVSDSVIDVIDPVIEQLIEAGGLRDDGDRLTTAR